MTLHITTTAIRAETGEPCILDTDLAAWLGLDRQTNIRQTISANYMELQAYGNLHLSRANSGQRGRPSSAYYLNEGQALVLCALSRTPKAAEVRKALIDLFMAYRAGKTVEVKQHRRKPPTTRQNSYDAAFSRNLAFLSAYRGDPEAIAELFAGMLTRLEMLEVH